MSDDRDRYRPKRPPTAVRAQTARPVSDRRSAADDAAPDDELWEDLTAPVHLPPVERNEWRQKRQSAQLQALHERNQRMLDELLTERRHREEREAEERRVREEREAEQLERLREEDRKERIANRKLTLGIVVPTIGAVAAGVAAVIAALASK